MAGFKGTITRHKVQQTPQVFRAFATQAGVALKHINNGCFWVGMAMHNFTA
jgi:hypothetical protein